MSAATLTYLDPSIPRKSDQQAMPLLQQGLHGKRIAYVENGWKSFVAMGERIEAVLRREFGIASFTLYRISTSSAPPKALLDRIAAESDAAIVGMAN